MEFSATEIAGIAVQVAMGVSLAACAGLRAFLPLLAVGVAGRLDWLPLSSSFQWLESWPALIVFGAAVVTELAADKIPVVDNFLDAAAGIVKPIAGVVVVASVLTDLSPLQTTVIAIVLGGATAGAVHFGKANLRLASTATTIGTANPVISVGEDAVAIAGTVVSLFLPVLAFVLFVIAVVLAWLVLRRLRRRHEEPAPAA